MSEHNGAQPGRDTAIAMAEGVVPLLTWDINLRIITEVAIEAPTRFWSGSDGRGAPSSNTRPMMNLHWQPEEVTCRV